MNNRERIMSILNYKDYDRMPVVDFGYWTETLEKWCNEGHLKKEEIDGLGDGNKKDIALGEKLGFDFNWQTMFYTNTGFAPSFERKVLEELPGGLLKIINNEGLIVIEKPGINSIPSMVGSMLTDRKVWEESYLPKLQFSTKRVDVSALKKLAEDTCRESPLGLHCGSLFGSIRDWLGFEGSSYLYADDEDLFDEIINTVGELTYKVVEYALSFGVKFDYAHYWEDICFKNGPLIIPRVFDEKVGPHYKKISELLNKNGINIISLDCDGMIDSLLPTWINNGVNTMFPIEVGTWNANIKPWKEKYGNTIRGVGGMNKNVFSRDYAAIDKEIERLKPLIALGGYIPCPDHRIPPEAKWENVQYYCELARKLHN